MGWFRKKQGPLDRQLHAIDEQLRQLDAQVRQLRRSPGKAIGTFQPGSTTFPAGQRSPANAAPIQPSPAETPGTAQREPDLHLPRERDLWSRPTTEEQQLRSSGNRQPWWRVLFGSRPGPHDPRLLNYLSTGSFKTVRPLRYERRMARYRYAFSFGVLGGIILLLVFALQKCG